MTAINRLSLLCGLSLLLFAGCESDTDAFVPRKPLVGFGNLEATLSLTGDTLQLPVYLTRALSETAELRFSFAGTAQLDDDFLLPQGDLITVPAGADLVYLPLVVHPEPDAGRIDRVIDVFLQTDNSLEVSERDSMRIVFGLAHTVNLRTWAPDEPFPQLYGYTSFGEEPVPEGSGPSAGEHFCFAYASTSRANVIGLYNQDTTRSTNALNMHRIYSDEEVSSGSARIRITEFIEFFPSLGDSTRGTVQVIAQDVTIRRRASSGLPPFDIGLSGSGTYDEQTGVITVDIYFDETAIGGEAQVLRRYSLEAEDRN
ncbi:MAG: hypothetical protein AAGJ82_07200 [Bacteroidota bacterium]